MDGRQITVEEVKYHFVNLDSSSPKLGRNFIYEEKKQGHFQYGHFRAQFHRADRHKYLLSMKLLPWWKQGYQPNFHMIFQE